MLLTIVFVNLLNLHGLKAKFFNHIGIHFRDVFENAISIGYGPLGQVVDDSFWHEF